MVGKRGCKFNVMAEEQIFVFSVTWERSGDTVIETIEGTDMIEFGGVLMIFKGTKKVAMFRNWVAVNKKTPQA